MQILVTRRRSRRRWRQPPPIQILRHLEPPQLAIGHQTGDILIKRPTRQRRRKKHPSRDIPACPTARLLRWLCSTALRLLPSNVVGE